MIDLNLEAMRMIRAWALAALALGCAGAAAVGCSNAGSSGAGAATSGAASSGGDDGGADRGDGGPSRSCIPSESTSAVANRCGVFVSSSVGNDATGNGTKEAPFQTLGKALGEAKGKPVYGCGEGFTETVTVTESATLYGALDCASGWVYDASKKTRLTAAANQIPLTVSIATTRAKVLDFAISSASATRPGASSIAALVAQAAASFTRCDVSAGDGMAGAAGTPYLTAAPAAAMGLPGADVCTAFQPLGGLAGSGACGNAGGNGGDGAAEEAGSAANGENGQPNATSNNGSGAVGLMPCTAGTKGVDGATIGAATPGLGATGFGTLTASGYTGVAGSDGGPGTTGQGGGGGGGAEGGAGPGMCPSGSPYGGASGGSGGAGGCGGVGGRGGLAGGSSIALASIDATLSFTSVTLEAGHGGKGGDGGDGQAGGMGGLGGPGGKAKTLYGNLNDACAGGPGGTGGPGGKGGGGGGGHSLGLAFTGSAPPMVGWTATAASFGAGGKGDEANGSMGDGTDGQAEECWDFDGSVACK